MDNASDTIITISSKHRLLNGIKTDNYSKIESE